MKARKTASRGQGLVQPFGEVQGGSLGLRTNHHARNRKHRGDWNRIAADLQRGLVRPVHPNTRLGDLNRELQNIAPPEIRFDQKDCVVTRARHQDDIIGK
jgi:hypothetical protein